MLFSLKQVEILWLFLVIRNIALMKIWNRNKLSWLITWYQDRSSTRTLHFSHRATARVERTVDSDIFLLLQDNLPWNKFMYQGKQFHHESWNTWIHFYALNVLKLFTQDEVNHVFEILVFKFFRKVEPPDRLSCGVFHMVHDASFI